MNRREAKRLVCRAAAALLEGGINAWAREDLADKDVLMLDEELQDLIAELRRRGDRAPPWATVEGS